MLIRLVTSRGTGVTEGPSGEAAFRTAASERPVRNTRHPRVANCRTTSSPMPLLAPVTRAMLGIEKSPLIPSAPIIYMPWRKSRLGVSPVLDSPPHLLWINLCTKDFLQPFGLSDGN